MIGAGVRELLRRGLDATGGGDKRLVDSGHALFIDRHGDHLCVGSGAYPGARATLAAIRASGAALALCTNNPEALARLLVKRLGWTFDAVVGGDTLAVRKLDAAPLREAVGRSGGGRAVLVGDSIIDAETAQSAALPFVAVTFGYSDQPVEALGVVATVDRLAGLPYVLAGL